MNDESDALLGGRPRFQEKVLLSFAYVCARSLELSRGRKEAQPYALCFPFISGLSNVLLTDSLLPVPSRFPQQKACLMLDKRMTRNFRYTIGDAFIHQCTFSFQALACTRRRSGYDSTDITVHRRPSGAWAFSSTTWSAATFLSNKTNRFARRKSASGSACPPTAEISLRNACRYSCRCEVSASFPSAFSFNLHLGYHWTTFCNTRG